VRLQGGVAGAIGLERAPVPVRAPAVGLDDQLVLGPAEIDRVAEQLLAADRAQELCLSERRPQRALELAAGRLGIVTFAAGSA
jgi:hypothetical protein